MDELLERLLRRLRAGREPRLLQRDALSVLQEIGAGQARFPAVHHPLGFIYAALRREWPLVLRLHIWLADAPRPTLTTSPIHDHTWQLTSFVVCGELENWTIQVESADDPTHRVFEIRGAGGEDLLRPTERLVRYRRSAVERVTPGGRYVVAAGQFHLTGVPTGLDTATIVLAERKATTPERSLGAPDVPEHRMTRQACAPADLAAAARTILASAANFEIGR